VSDGETLYSVFEQAFPQANWRQLVPADVMAKFAASRGGQFPAPQYSNGLAVALGRGAGGSGGVPRNGGGGGGGSGGGGSKVAAGAPLKGSGVVLIGDAAHCFPPDLGERAHEPRRGCFALGGSRGVAARGRRQCGDARAPPPPHPPAHTLRPPPAPPGQPTNQTTTQHRPGR
jgi:hypothetical protein